MEKGQ